jgi:hypothetical protein
VLRHEITLPSRARAGLCGGDYSAGESRLLALQEERPYWEEYFELVKVQDVHDRRKCRDENGSEPWACGDCDCTARLEAKVKDTGKPFLELLHGSSTDPTR